MTINTEISAGTIESIGFSPGDNRGIALLEAITETGSINGAAQRLKMSYKAAWEQVETLNNLADAPLLSRTVGGSGGGGTQLTPAGRALIVHYRRVEHEYAKFMQFINEEAAGAAELSRMLRRMQMKVSARNIWSGKVRSISDGAVNSVVEVDLRGGDQIVATITRQSVESLNLSPGCEVMALVKSSAVMLARDLRPGQVSARNLLCGRVCRIVEGAVNCEVTLQLPGGSTVHAVITRESAIHLDLQPESELCALIKASSVLLAIA